MKLNHQNKERRSTLPTPGRPKIKYDLKQQIIKLYIAGKSYREIKDQLHVSLGTIHNYLSEYYATEL